MLRPVLAWLAILVLAVLNGVVREALRLPGFARTAAYLSSGLILSVLWPRILAPYMFADGNIWPLVLVVVLFAPWLAWRFRAAS